MENSLAVNLADASWQRLRSMALATERYENFVALGSSNMSDDKSNGKWTPNLKINPPEALALDYLSMTIRDAFERENSEIMLQLSGTEQIQPLALSEKLGMAELSLRERLGNLSQCGLVMKNLESGGYLLTDAGDAVANLIRDAVTNLSLRIEKELPELNIKKEELKHC
ncbi:MAG: hypothetical protein IIB39_00055 [Candidatus Marinimicrobia bacterium]|nr:hypothetical protein [Candidatus Neomarinimicrobiota bacterium]